MDAPTPEPVSPFAKAIKEMARAATPPPGTRPTLAPSRGDYRRRIEAALHKGGPAQINPNGEHAGPVDGLNVR